MSTTLDFDILDKFVTFAKAAHGKGELNHNAFKTARHESSFVSTLMQGHQSALEALGMLNNLNRTLNSLAWLVEEGNLIAHDEHLPSIYNKGFYSLPFEIVGHIFELSLDKDLPISNSSILLVNRHFHDIAVQTPGLWTTISNYQNPYHFLERSGTLGLDIIIRALDEEYEMETVQVERFCKLLLPHTTRWKSFLAEISSRKLLPVVSFSTRDKLPGSSAGILLKSLRDIFKEKNLSHLQTLAIRYEPVGSLREHRLDTYDSDGSCRNFFSTWDMPALRSVIVGGITPAIPAACRSSLTYFQLELFDESSSGPITQLLLYLPALEGLSIKFSNIWLFKRDESDDPVELTCLKSLEFATGYSSVEAVSWFVDIISAPNVEKLSLTVLTHYCSNVKRIINTLFPKKEERWPLLNALSCQIESLDYDYDAFRILCGRLSHLQHLSIQTRTLEPPSSLKPSSQDENHPLRTLRLFSCAKFTADFIHRLSSILNSPDFEMLEIVECPNIDEDVVRELMPEDKRLNFIACK